MRKPIAAANWKMNGDCMLIEAFAQAAPGKVGVQTLWAMSATLLYPAREAGLAELAGEDVSAYENGAYTGEISACMLKEAGCTYCIIGHSERRSIHREDEALLKRKWRCLKNEGIAPIYCIGESAAEYEQGATEQAIKRQIMPMLEAGLIDDTTIIAYEPVWAIGTGKAATPDYAQQVHRMIRAAIAQHCATIGEEVRILYGGSVRPENTAALIAKADIDGFLVGGASLEVKAFANIIEAIS